MAPLSNSRVGPGAALNAEKYNTDVQKLKDKIKHLAIEKEMLEKELTTQKQEMQLEYQSVKVPQAPLLVSPLIPNIGMWSLCFFSRKSILFTSPPPKKKEKKKFF